MSKSSSVGSGIGFPGFLTLLFIGLKLADVGVVATWSWLWVLSPLWISFSVLLALIAICALILGLFAIFDKK